MKKSISFVASLLLCCSSFVWGTDKTDQKKDSIAMHKSISEVVVYAQRSTVQVTPEKRVIHIGSSPIASSGNAYSVLKNLPGIIVNSDGSVFLNGKSGVKVLIDGKSSYLEGTELVNYLMSLPASSLDKVELVTRPSAKYEASGNAGIIDICIKRNNQSGFSLNVHGNYEQGKYGRTNDNLSFTYRRDKLNLSGMYGYYRGHDFNDLTIARYYPETATEQAMVFDQDSYRRRSDYSHYANFSMDYYATPKTTFGIALKGNISDRTENGSISSLFHAPAAQADSTLRSLTDNGEKRKNFTLSLTFQHKIDSLGKTVSASVDGLYYSVEEDQWHNDRVTIPSMRNTESTSKAFKDGTIKMISGRTDLTWPVSDKLRFEAGAKSDFVHIDNRSDYANLVGSQWVADKSLSSTFYYRENINALYATAKMQKGAMAAEAGVRVENTNIKLTSFSQSYTDLFPNLSLTCQLPHNNSLNFTYGKRVDRPNYRYLNPFVYIFDTYTYEQGNTNLKPQFTDRFDLAYLIRKNYRFGLFYTDTRQAIIKSYTVQPGSRRVYVMPTNMVSYRSYGLQGDIGQLSVARWFQSGMHLELTQNNYKWEENEIFLRNRKLTFQIGIQNKIRLPWGCTAEVSGFYNSEMAYGQVMVLPVWQLSGGIQKNLCKGNATLSIFSNDWFNSNRTRVKGNFSGTYATTDDFQDRCIVGISFTYRFKKGEGAKESKSDKSFYDSKRINL
ncbi:outer membrane beta-barrel family protein [Paludibacter jiangxiensis]|uniref:Outer membrane receptor proteins n=1 Tax=Paludibacter jiangxiensis TaxID=681398 RepID=A0A161LF74_9BACT|nr:outer membrane beta-barrel family protein [Paludibacter jiangxiensis]GAT63595.1 outer membrane receptor proteins [Paludibacter jiangxiensis]